MNFKRHRNEIKYPALWKAVDGAIISAIDAHPEIKIPNRASIVKRVVGQVLALDARSAESDEMPA